jgi:hypothetical protein
MHLKLPTANQHPEKKKKKKKEHTVCELLAFK